jgi:hypothetical protein
MFSRMNFYVSVAGGGKRLVILAGAKLRAELLAAFVVLAFALTTQRAT